MFKRGKYLNFAVLVNDVYVTAALSHTLADVPHQIYDKQDKAEGDQPGNHGFERHRASWKNEFHYHRKQYEAKKADEKYEKHVFVRISLN